MASFRGRSGNGSGTLAYKFYFRNRSSVPVYFSVEWMLSGVSSYSWVGGVKDVELQNGQDALCNFDIPVDRYLQSPKALLCTIGGKALFVRFWSGFVEHFDGNNSDQYINLLEDNGFQVSKDSSEYNEVVGNGVRVSLDGGGHNMDTMDIFVQIYDH